MAHILLLILKIIGIILLVIIGLILLLVLSVLFVPIRYSGRASYDEAAKCDIRVTWLLHILSFRIGYEEVLTARFRVFGYTVFKETLFGDDEEDTEPETEAEIKEGFADTLRDIVRIPRKTGEVAEDYAPGQDRDRKKDAAGGRDKVPPDSEPGRIRSRQQAEQTVSKPAGRTGEAGGRKVPDQDTGSRGFFWRIKQWFLGLIEKLRFSFEKFCDKLKEIKDKKEGFQNFINDEANRATFSLLLKQGKRFLKHVLPRKIKGRIAFGFDDPYTTGQVLMYASPFLGWYHRHLSLEPYFDQVVLEGNVNFKGRIRIATVLFLGFVVYRDRNFRKLLKQWREK